MRWEETTSERLGRAIEESDGVCLLPIACIERHGPHLPLGTDWLIGQAVVDRAAREEPVVVFPALPLGQIAEARHCPGTISLPHELLLSLVNALMDEIGRNGFRKIVIVNCHGGNTSLLDYLMRSCQRERRTYVPYVCNAWEMEEDDARRWAEMRESAGDGHAGEFETSIVMHVRPETVRMEAVTDPTDWPSRRLQADLGGLENPWSWYAKFPTHFAGDPRPATPEKGAFLVEAWARHLVNCIRRIKADDVTPRLAEQFYRMAEGAGREQALT